jgi:serine/threonine protein kinase
MAPQLLMKEPYTSKCDIWSIGMMYYEMLFGKTPWPARDKNSLIRNITELPLKFPYEKPISPSAMDFLKRCLVVDEFKRISWDEIFKHSVL